MVSNVFIFHTFSSPNKRSCAAFSESISPSLSRIVDFSPLTDYYHNPAKPPRVANFPISITLTVQHSCRRKELSQTPPCISTLLFRKQATRIEQEATP